MPLKSRAVSVRLLRMNAKMSKAKFLKVYEFCMGDFGLFEIHSQEPSGKVMFSISRHCVQFS